MRATPFLDFCPTSPFVSEPKFLKEEGKLCRPKDFYGWDSVSKPWLLKIKFSLNDKHEIKKTYFQEFIIFIKNNPHTSHKN